MPRKKSEPEAVTEPKKIEAVKMGETRVGMSTLNHMNKITGQLIELVYILEARIEALEAKKD